MKVLCKHNHHEVEHAERRDLPTTTRLWSKVLPFNVNPRGKLIHRVRQGASHYLHGRYQHDSIHYWCEGQVCSSGMDLTDNPPENRLLCVGCEKKAVAAGEKPADKLAGRHVHLGVLKPHRICCRNEEN